MLGRSSCLLLVLGALATACSLDRSGLAVRDVDAATVPPPPLDMGLRDSGRDAMIRDLGPDAPPPRDGGPDASDGGRDMGSCPGGGRPEVEICDGLDQDCSGIVDDGECQARIPAGPFMMGCVIGDEPLCDDPESPTPAHEVILSAYFIDRTEVTWEAYERCVDDGSCGAVPQTLPRSPRQPIAEITYDEARVYCAWRGASLPTEAQWERAARGSSRLLYPWGTAPFECTRAHGYGCVPMDTLEVGTLVSGNTPDTTISDLAGNVGEWVLDYASATYYLESAGATDPTGPSAGTARVIRGGGFQDPNPANSVRAAHRGATPPTTRLPGLGFRCARRVP